MRKSPRLFKLGGAEVGSRLHWHGLGPQIARPEEEHSRLRHHHARPTSAIGRPSVLRTEKTVRMRIAIASDIHGNKHAFEAVIAAAEAAEADELWCLGDLVGYGGDPDALGRAGRSSTARSAWPATTTWRSSTCSRSRTSRAAPRSPPSGRKETIKPETREFLLSLSPEGGAEGVGLYHASPRDPIWEYVLSGLTAELCLDTTDYRVSFIGHSHVALSFHRNEGESATGSTRREGDRARHLAPASG